MAMRRAKYWVLMLGLLLPPASEAGKGPTLNVGDDPTLGAATAELVLIEVADFQ